MGNQLIGHPKTNIQRERKGKQSMDTSKRIERFLGTPSPTKSFGHGSVHNQVTLGWWVGSMLWLVRF